MSTHMTSLMSIHAVTIVIAVIIIVVVIAVIVVIYQKYGDSYLRFQQWIKLPFLKAQPS